MSDKIPQPGEWWQKGDVRVLVIGQTKKGSTVCEHENSVLDAFDHRYEYGWQHLPDCTGWDWQPETFPQYWSTISPKSDVAYVVRYGPGLTEWKMAFKQGGYSSVQATAWDATGRVRITQEQAHALIQKPFNKFATLANEIEQLRADMMRRCDELGVRLTELEEGSNG